MVNSSLNYSVVLTDPKRDYKNATCDLSLTSAKTCAMSYLIYPGVEISIDNCTGLLGSEEKTFEIT